MIQYWRYHSRISEADVRRLFNHQDGYKPEVTDTYAMAVFLAGEEEMSVRHTIDNRCKDNHYSWCMYDMDGYEIDNLVGLS